MVTPILHSFEPVIAASSNFLMKSCLMAASFFVVQHYPAGVSASRVQSVRWQKVNSPAW